MPYQEEIRAFMHADSIAMPPDSSVLFVGSSSLRMWPNLDRAFPECYIINRGFGGSSLTDVIRYADQIIFPYHPRQIVIYCGENDLTNDTVNAAVVFDRFKTLFELIRTGEISVPVIYISIKPSISRESLMPEIEAANALISGYMAQQENAFFIDIYHDMLAPDNHPLPNLYQADMLHMNSAGYAIWQKKLEPYLSAR